MGIYLVENPYAFVGYYVIQADNINDVAYKMKLQLKADGYEPKWDRYISIKEVKFNDIGVYSEISLLE